MWTDKTGHVKYDSYEDAYENFLYVMDIIAGKY